MPNRTTVKKTMVLGLFSLALFQAACIGRQPAQQGTWSKQDGFRNKVSDQWGHAPEKAAK